MSEAIEYRIKRSKETVKGLYVGAVGLIGLLVVVAALPVSAVIGVENTSPVVIVGAYMLALSLVGAVIVQSRETDGYCRLFCSKLGVEYHDPPLKVWKKSLQERGELGGSK